jgi:hypothetical protein
VDDAEFKRQINAISQGISQSEGSYAAWREIKPIDERRKRLNRWRGFFIPVQESLRQTTLLGIARAYDGDGRTMSVRNLIKAAVADPALTPHANAKQIQEVEARLDKIEPELKKLARMRNQELAHQDAAPNRKEVLTTEEFDHVLSELKGILNDLSRAHDQSIFDWRMIVEDAERDTKLLVDELTIGAKEHSRKILSDSQQTLRDIQGESE